MNHTCGGLILVKYPASHSLLLKGRERESEKHKWENLSVKIDNLMSEWKKRKNSDVNAVIHHLSQA